MINKSLFTSLSDEWATPQELFNNLDDLFHFDLDPCCTYENHKCKNYFTICENGLNQSWFNKVVFCNPPYSDIKNWVKKCYNESFYNNAFVVLLIPSRTDTKYFHDYICGNCEIYFIKGRLKFNNKGSAPFPSMICVFDGIKHNFYRGWENGR